MTICFDLDGTICETDDTLPLSDRYRKAVVKPKMKNLVNSLYEKGHIIVIETARGSTAKGLFKYFKRKKLTKLTYNQLKEWKVPYHQLRVGVKIPADVYIDDKCVPVTLLERDI